MPKIKLLDKHTAELIAAGEVVERPSSVVKELMENSIDAGAHTVTVEIQHGGNTYLRITDDGCGIAPEDVKTAFLRHATSKIQTETDLDAITTLGFRGEALASVAAVSKVELITRTKDDELGTRYVTEGGEEIDFDECGTAVGTTIVVRDLFFNTPARQKFLKKDVSEGNAVTAVVDRLALSHPEVAFKLIRDGKEVLSTPGDGEQMSAIYSVIGKAFAESLVSVAYSMNGIRVSGFVTKPFLARANRNMQFFYISGRYVKTKTAMAALEEAYKHSMMVGRFPGCVLNIEIPPEQVDVNVHPAKIEVRFSDEQALFRAVFYAVKSALAEDRSAPEFKLSPATQSETAAEPLVDAVLPQLKTPVKQPEFNFFAQLPIVNHAETKPPSETAILRESETFSYSSGSPEPRIDFEKPKVNLDLFPEVEEEPKEPPFAAYIEKSEETQLIRYIGEAFETYILAEIGDKLVFVDKHAAHERILFEQIKADVKHETQILLTPVPVRLSAEEYNAFTENIESVNAAGFETEEYGEKTILVRGLPMSLDKEDAEGLISEMAGKLLKEKDFTPEFLDWLYHSVACRAAIKAGNHSSSEELRKLVGRVLENDDIRYCPHGRPTTVELSKNEIQKRFGRI